MKSASWRADWVLEKCEIAAALSRGEAGGTYPESAILVCAALSALSAEVWPGRGIDRKRFIELLVRLAPSTTTTSTRISVPLLVRHLFAAGDDSNAAVLKKSLLDFSPTRIVVGPEVDRGEAELLAACPSLDLKTIRLHSYACLLYEEVRSSYAHEYRPGSRADSWAMTKYEGQAVSYVNRLLERGASETGRFIHFHIEWLRLMAVELASTVDALAPTIPRSLPVDWWIEGAT
jgi:hypothetical protein